MAFGNASLPTRKYVFGAREFLPGPRAASGDTKAPRQRFIGHDIAVDQLFRAHRYQNDLIKIEQDRRTRASEIVHTSFPDLAALLATAETLSTDIATLRDQISTLKAQTRAKTPDAALAAQTRARATESAAAWCAYTARKNEAYADPAIRASLDANDATASAQVKILRDDAIAKGLYWATAAIVAQRIKKSGSPPRFKRWDHEGLIAVQFQRKPDKSSPQVAVLDAQGNPRIHPRSGRPSMRFEGGASLRTGDVFKQNTLCWIERTEHPKHVTVHFRVGSTPSGSPVWAKLPVNMHRPFPPNAEIKWAYLSRRKIGTHFKWEVQFDVAASELAWTIADADRTRERAKTGTVGVALGWRLIDGAVRVAVWAGSDGRTGEITIPVERVTAWLKCDELQSVRDKQFDADIAYFREFLSSLTEMPPAWADRTETACQWRSPARLAAFVLFWRNNRIPGDEAAYTRLEGEYAPAPRDANGNPVPKPGEPARFVHGRYTGGRKQDKHLYDWQSFRRLRCQRWRKQFYADAAIALAKHYAIVSVAEIYWHAIAENPAPEELDAEVNKKYRGIAAGAMLRDELTDRMHECRVPAPGITVNCHACGVRCNPPGRGRWVRCERCGGEDMDRAENAAKNLLQRSLAEQQPSEPAREM